MGFFSSPLSATGPISSNAGSAGAAGSRGGAHASVPKSLKKVENAKRKLETLETVHGDIASAAHEAITDLRNLRETIQAAAVGSSSLWGDYHMDHTGAGAPGLFVLGGAGGGNSGVAATQADAPAIVTVNPVVLAEIVALRDSVHSAGGGIRSMAERLLCNDRIRFSGSCQRGNLDLHMSQLVTNGNVAAALKDVLIVRWGVSKRALNAAPTYYHQTRDDATGNSLDIQHMKAAKVILETKF